MEQTFTAPYKPVVVTDADVAFPAHVVGKLLPAMENIPEEFRRGRTEWNRLVDEWFAYGLKPAPEVAEGLDKSQVWRHLKCCMGSYEPKHEHKTAGVAYLMSLWLKPLKENKPQ